MSKHTTGPWHYFESGSVKSKYGVIIKQGFDFNDKEMELANARLIAAAPDLLEALLDMVSAMESYGYPHSPEVSTARAAITKAIGA